MTINYVPAISGGIKIVLTSDYFYYVQNLEIVICVVPGWYDLCVSVVASSRGHAVHESRHLNEALAAQLIGTEIHWHA